MDDFIKQAGFLFKDEPDFDSEAVDKYLKDKAVVANLLKLKDRLEELNSFEPGDIETAMRSLAGELGIESGELIHPARVALTGRSVAPGIFEVMHLIGKERVIKRLADIAL